MTATDELRLMLDERGVEWMPSAWSAKDETFYKVGDVGYLATELSSGKMKVCIEGYPTTEQAIAATLGGGYQGFWTHDGTLHIELPKLPESISVRLPDKRDREVRSARVWQYTLGDADATRERQGVGTCHANKTETWQGVCISNPIRYVHNLTIHVMECSACGGTYEYVNGSYEYCPRCGAKVVNE